MISNYVKTIGSAALLLGATSCYKTVGVNPGDGLEDWTVDTHSGDATPDYSIVFPSNSVNELKITIAADDWTTMQNDLDDIMAGSGGPGPGSFSDETPIYVPCTVEFNGKKWYYVGIRYKGNSSLHSSYNMGIDKYPLRLDFDKFEDEHPEIWNQCFYGFNELSMGNNFKDVSFMRQKVADDIMRDFGIPSARSAYYRVYIDNGSGTQYYGLYTMCEVVFDTHLANAFGSETGNCYKPDGDAASFESGTFNTEELEKKTNEAVADWSDLQELYDILHDGSRTSNPSQWRSDLDARFDTDIFLKWLAANTTFQNWDTYGNMTHNYYLYTDPADNKIKWIPWDNNESFSSGGGPNGPLDFDFNSVGNDWPLIRYLIDDATYKAKYDQYIQDFIDGPYEETVMNQRFQDEYNVIYNSVAGSIVEENGYTFMNSIPADFVNELSALQTHLSGRHSAADTYLGN